MRDYRQTADRLVAAERRRQVEAEGYSAEHDRRHGSGPLIQAAMVYAGDQPSASWWPWDDAFYKPYGAVRDLTRAAALAQAALQVEQQIVDGGRDRAVIGAAERKIERYTRLEATYTKRLALTLREAEETLNEEDAR